MTFPVSSETGTMCFAVSSRYGTPLGLIIITPARRSTAETLPKVPMTRPVSARRLFARNTASRNVNDGSLLEREQPLHQRREVRPRACHAARLRRANTVLRDGGQAEGVVQLAI